VLDERRRRVAARQARPLQFAESVGDAFVRLRRAVDDDRQQEGLVRRDQVGAIDLQLPLEPAFPSITLPFTRPVYWLPPAVKLI